MLKLETKTWLVVGAVALMLGVLAFRKAKAAAVDLLTNKLNPASGENIIYDGVIGGIGRAVTGDKDFSLGGSIYDALHPGEVFNDPDQAFCTNLLGIGCPRRASPYDGVIDENDPTFILN